MVNISWAQATEPDEKVYFTVVCNDCKMIVRSTCLILTQISIPKKLPTNNPKPQGLESSDIIKYVLHATEMKFKSKNVKTQRQMAFIARFMTIHTVCCRKQWINVVV